ncbi:MULTISPECIES: Lrp/AsnC family transcriptional regulator [Streptomyces]|uniref:Transcriptional regulator n=1 Tax=Streptomyces albus (strain ATCC 21838 / DSM 41398 / FERM P-419 / JCM 4703 / NBRC 107858) TaxID=1081613 RepID=A0A0B5EHC5_STRA4|nr:AsnC family transcriptional regulator [Streptomyces sp. SCSIO ZS0520]AJE80804.1 transcriptional regulator [Streptomyces albus]AOU75115.1 transcriptional regulator [Streptomyces albus]AYN30921.1 AsnC family transcriptional regulator [Streptomyces albus]
MRTDAFDLLDRQLVQALEIDGRAPFSRIAEVLGVSDQTVARRYRRLRTALGLRVVGMRDALRTEEGQWMMRLRCTPDGAEPIAAALAKRPDTAWVGLASGGTEVLCSTHPRSRDEHDELLFGKLPRTPSIVELRAHQVLHRFAGGPLHALARSGELTGEQRDRLRPRYQPGTGPGQLTPEDGPLLAALERDGRAGYPELQKATGRSESAVKRRLEALLASGALYIDTELDHDRLGYGQSAQLWITAAPGALDEVGRSLAAHPQIPFAAATTGSSNLVASVLVRDTAELYAYLSGPLGTLDGVLRIETLPVLRRVKRLTYPSPPRG